MSIKRIFTDSEKVKAIVEWPEPKTIFDVRSFHGLATFYKHFIKNYGSVIAPITDCLRKGEFTQTKPEKEGFNLIKKKMTEALVLCHPDFPKVFEVVCDA